MGKDGGVVNKKRLYWEAEGIISRRNPDFDRGGGLERRFLQGLYHPQHPPIQRQTFLAGRHWRIISSPVQHNAGDYTKNMSVATGFARRRISLSLSICSLLIHGFPAQELHSHGSTAQEKLFIYCLEIESSVYQDDTDSFDLSVSKH